MRHKHWFLFAFLGTAWMVGCGSGGKESPAPVVPGTAVVPPPTSLAVKEEGQPGAFVLTWVAPTAPVDGYELEAKLPGSSFQKIHAGAFAPVTPTTRFQSPVALPELSEVAFRIRSQKGQDFSAYSPEVMWKAKPFEPRMWVDTSGNSTLDPEVVLLKWQTRSKVATISRLERTQLDAQGQPTTWRTLAELPATTLSYEDREVEEAASYQYRLSSLANGIQSAYSTASAKGPAILSPNRFNLTAEAGRVRLSWNNRSTLAAEVRVERASGMPNSFPNFATVAVLPATAQAYVDEGLPVNFYTYRIVAAAASVSGKTPQQMVALPASGELQLLPSLLPIPVIDGIGSHLDAMPTASGWVHVGKMTLNGRDALGAYVQNGTGWRFIELPGGGDLKAPYLRLDAQGRIHALVTLRDVNTGDGLLNHAVFEKGAWTVTKAFGGTIANDSANVGVRWTLDGQGNVHALLTTRGTSYGEVVTYLSDASGAWKTEVPDLGTGYSSPIPFDIDVDSKGRVAAVLAGRPLRLLKRSDLGSWSLESAPQGTGASWYDPLCIACTEEGTALFFEQRGGSGLPDYLEKVVFHTGLSWKDPELLYSRSHDGSSTRSRLLISPDRRRMAYVLWLSRGLALFVRDSGESWKRVDLPPRADYGLLSLGFTARNKLWALYGADATWGIATGQGVLYQEP